MRPLLILSFLLVFSNLAQSQSVAASNFNHWYNPLNEVELQLRPVRAANKIIVRYTLLARNGHPEKYSITWEARNSFVERDGVPVREKDSVLSVSGKDKRGFISFDVPEKPWLLLGHVTNGSSTWTYFKQIESIYPVDGWMETGGWVRSVRGASGEVDSAIRGVLERTDFVLGADVTAFETEFARYCETAHAIERRFRLRLRRHPRAKRLSARDQRQPRTMF